MSKLLVILSLFFCFSAGANAVTAPDSYAGNQNVSQQPDHHPHPHTFFDWGRGQNGWGYCYEFDHHGYVLNNGRPVHPYNCEQVNPSYFDWGRSFDGYIYCYQWTPYRVIMNDGYPVHPRYCQYR